MKIKIPRVSDRVLAVSCGVLAAAAGFWMGVLFTMRTVPLADDVQCRRALSLAFVEVTDAHRLDLLPGMRRPLPVPAECDDLSHDDYLRLSGAVLAGEVPPR